ncbi:probable glucan endo-1,3-beta-glucosidase BG4 [Cucurbita maxima]|uniref:glucan endo-1,3-beta-D-glucosidase n=1 Tax=Cucurbita maxima TaxID=3661 RepID=A0A6J1HVR6_CUCMA|nr:probable glucan endo-1,3-beta-glucosidase BG4 [Cucurbita maxima]
MVKISHMIGLFMADMFLIVGAYDVLLGAYYGLLGDNLSSPASVVQLCRKYNISRVRLEVSNIDVIEAFRGTEIDLSLGVPNDMLPNMATNKTLVEEWFNTYVEPYVNDYIINYIVVGDKAIPGLDDNILPVMKSLQDLLNAHYFGEAKLTTLVGFNALAVTNPPSSGAFNPAIVENMRGILEFLRGEGSPLMVSVYTYDQYVYGGNRSLGYATLSEQNSLVRDGMLSYNNLFDEMVDAFYAAIDKENVGDVAIVIGETGWPTCGNYNATTPLLAAEYNRNFKSHISSGKGTPRKENIYIEGFIRSIFNENQKPEGESRCYGMFNVDSTPIYSPVF